MSITEFQLLFANNFLLYIITLFCTSFLLLIICKKLRVSILEPIVPAFISISFAMSMIIFLYLVGRASEYDFILLMVCYISLFAGLFTFPVHRLKYDSHLVNHRVNLLRFILIPSFFVYVGCALFVFYKAGIPLFMESRLGTFNSGGGFGIVSRIGDASAYLVVFLSSWLFILKKHRKIQVLVLFIYFLISLLMGGKSGFFLLLFCIYLANTFTNQESKLPLKYIFLLILFISVYYVIMNSVDIFTAVFFFIQRLMKFGDVYYLTLPNSIYNNLELSVSGVEALFGDLLGMTRFYSWSEFGKPLGFQAYDIVNPKNSILTGPNVRFDIFFVIYFGLLSPLFSFILGLVISFIRGPLLNFICKQGSEAKIIYGFLSIQFIVLITDPVYGMTKINNTLFLIPLLFFPLFLYYAARVTNEKDTCTIKCK